MIPIAIAAYSAIAVLVAFACGLRGVDDDNAFKYALLWPITIPIVVLVLAYNAGAKAAKDKSHE